MYPGTKHNIYQRRLLANHICYAVIYLKLLAWLGLLLGFLWAPRVPMVCATCGMLFVYPQADRRGFYTKHVFMELDVGYFGEDGRLLEWRTMAADDARNTFPAGEAFQYALAVPAGWFARHQIRKYAVLRLPHDLRAL